MQVRETQFTDRVWGIKTSHYPLKPPLNLSSKVTYKKSRSYILENPEWSNAGYWWTMDVDTEMFTPVVKPSDVSPTPMHALKMIKCACSSCFTVRCSWSNANLSCSVFCKYAVETWKNPNTIFTMEEDDYDAT